MRGPLTAGAPRTGRRRSRSIALFVATLAWLPGCVSGPRGGPPPGVEALFTTDGVQLTEGGAPVLLYRFQPIPGREPWRTNYVHPVYSPAGAIVTEDAPADHVHHRGIFWAWRRILVDGTRVADGWVGDGLALEVAAPSVTAYNDGSAQVNARATWVVQVAGQPTAIIEENSAIRGYPVVDGSRRIDVTVELRALRPGVEIAGTDDEKGYGGLSLRFGNPQLAEIETDGRALHATNAGMATGEWVRFNWPTLLPPWPASISASCEIDGRSWKRWVLRQEPSMQNCAFPGAVPTAVPTDRPLRLEVTLVIE